MEEKLTQLKAKIDADNNFREKLFGLETAEQVQSLLKEEGLDFSVEEITELKEALIKAAARQQSGELSDGDLEDVAGGSVGSVVGEVVDAHINVIGNIIRRRW